MSGPSIVTLMVKSSQVLDQCPSDLAHRSVDRGALLWARDCICVPPRISPLTSSPLLGLPILIGVPGLTLHSLKAVSPYLSPHPARGGSRFTKKARLVIFPFPLAQF